jgi:hypothetical protein
MVSGHETGFQESAGTTVGVARSIVGQELRRIDTLLEEIPTPGKMETLLAQMPVRAGLMTEDLEEVLLSRRDMGLAVRHDIARQAPALAASDLLTLGIGYAVRNAGHHRELRAADERVESDARKYAVGTSEADLILSELVREAETRRRQVLDHGTLSARRAEMAAAMRALSKADPSDMVCPQVPSLDALLAAMHAQGPDLSACMRLRTWLEALERCGVSPVLASPDPSGLGRSPLERVLRDEVASFPEATPGPLSILDQPLVRRVRQLVPSDSVRHAMDAIAELRSRGMGSIQLIQGAAAAVVLGVDPVDMLHLHSELVESSKGGHAAMSAPSMTR